LRSEIICLRLLALLILKFIKANLKKSLTTIKTQVSKLPE